MTEVELKKAVAIITEANRKREHQQRTVPRVWPPPESLEKKWESYGLTCTVARGTVALCGYVLVPVNHPCAELSYDEVQKEVDVEVHGGLTWQCRDVSGGMWFGFDCGHKDDWISTSKEEMVGTPFTVEDVEKEVEGLAKQLSETTWVEGKENADKSTN